MTINERIKQIWKDSGLTMQKFGARIGITTSSVSTMVNGKSNPSDQTILSICREFNVNEDWLRTGRGEMFQAASRAEAMEADLRRILTPDGDSFREQLVSALLRLDPEQWEVIERYAMKIVGDRTAPPPESIEEETRREAEEWYQRRLAEKKRESSTSPDAGSDAKQA